MSSLSGCRANAVSYIPWRMADGLLAATWRMAGVASLPLSGTLRCIELELSRGAGHAD